MRKFIFLMGTGSSRDSLFRKLMQCYNEKCKFERKMIVYVNCKVNDGNE